MFVADYRMPQMSGIEFLEKAMDLYPAATPGAADRLRRHPRRHRRHQRRRPGPLPAQAVGSARGEALPGHRRRCWRPGGPRREQPDPAHQGDRPPLESARSWEVRDFLARNGLHYHWFMADEPKGEQLLDAAGLDGMRLPVVITEQRRPARRADRRRAGRQCSACRRRRRRRCTTSS